MKDKITYELIYKKVLKQTQNNIDCFPNHDNLNVFILVLPARKGRCRSHSSSEDVLIGSVMPPLQIYFPQIIPYL